MTFYIEINTDNAAFEDEGLAYEIRRILDGIHLDLIRPVAEWNQQCDEERNALFEVKGILRDFNGNRVGQYGFKE